jgi:hypothetical protein
MLRQLHWRSLEGVLVEKKFVRKKILPSTYSTVEVALGPRGICTVKKFAEKNL